MPHFQLDDAHRPQDDLFRRVNGHFLDTVAIPDDKSGAGAFYDLRDASEAAVLAILTDAELSQTAPARLFASFMDEQRAEQLGSAPLATRLAAVDALDSIPALLAHLGTSLRDGVGSLLAGEAESDPGDPQRYALFLGQGGLGLPDEAYYRLPEHADILTAYRQHVGAMLTLAGAANEADAVVDLETRIAGFHWDNVRTRDIEQMYNPMPAAELDAGLGWTTALTAAGLGHVERIINCQPSFFTDVATLLTPEHLPAWRAWARWHLIDAYAPYLSTAFVEADFGFHGTTLQGVPQLKERWKRGVALVERALGEEVGKTYVQRHFPPASKQRMDVLVANLIEAYRRSITDLEWMTDATKAEALTKLAKFTPKIGYPDVWRDYTGLTIDAGDLVGNVERSRAFEFAYAVGKLAGPVDKHEWLMTPQTVNAYYHPFRNEIVFPAAILQPPFFDPDADDAVNYGAIGAVIGHEIGHGFDDQGATCDGDGALRDWWTAADREAFAERTKALIAQYDVLHPRQLPDLHVNGALTVGENIGDLGGLSIALLAWRLATTDVEPQGVDGQSPLARLFYSWANTWQTKRRDEALKQQIATDPHSPEEFRCNQVVRNLPEFHDEFATVPGDGLWLAPEERVKIW
ncbi:MAG: M13-type metalloendopeptidase [Propionibacteriaceae bacterium]|nr:peptidase M13 [Micropruina sp.]HBX81672.1 peptidase M13 [Propionibacteriaceae bacterium]HBY24285.1 peptidase M13 [Propionibacteriaceae bacterium]